jgi:hypothetical protein
MDIFVYLDVYEQLFIYVYSLINVQEIILAPEKYLGFYMGVLITCFLFWLLSLRVGILQDFESMNDPDSGSLYLNSLLYSLTPPLGDAFLNIGGLSGSTDDFGLFIAVIVSLVVGAVLWSQLVWISTDPGGIYTREQDFYMVSFLFIYFPL